MSEWETVSAPSVPKIREWENVEAPDPTQKSEGYKLQDAFNSPSFLGAVGENIKTIGKAAVDPEFYKGIGRDLANFPKADFSDPKVREEMAKQSLDIALSTLPVTPLSKASRAFVTGNKFITPAKEAVLKQSQSLGLKVSPTEVNPSFTNTALESIGGKTATAQKVSAKNQKIFTDLVTKDLGLPKDTPLTREALETIRDTAGKVYEQAKGLGTFTVDDVFVKSLKDISKSQTALSKELPGLLDKGVGKLVNQFKKKTLSAEATVEAIKELRGMASDNYLTNKTLSRAQRSLANSLESLMERNIAKTDAPQFLKAFRQAREMIAKSYTVGDALVGSEISGATLSRELQKGTPLTGGLKDIAQFSENFPRASQLPSKTGGAGVSRLQFLESLLAGGGGLAAFGPSGVAAAGLPIVGPPLARAGLLSNTFQKSLLPTQKTSNFLLQRGLLGYGSQ